MTTAPSLTALVSPAAVDVASVTCPQILHGVPVVTLVGTARVALTRVYTALTMMTTQSVCATSLVTMVTDVTLSAPTWDIVVTVASVCAISRPWGSTVKYQPARGVKVLMVHVHPTVRVTMRHVTAHVTVAGWVLRVTLLIAQVCLTVINVATATTRLTRPAARTVQVLGWDLPVMTHVSEVNKRQRTQGIVFAILAGWESAATRSVLVMDHLMELNVYVTMTWVIKGSSVRSMDVQDCTNSTVVGEVSVMSICVGLITILLYMFLIKAVQRRMSNNVLLMRINLDVF